MSAQAKTPAAKPAGQPAPKKSGGIGSGWIILGLAVVAHLVFHFIFGDSSHFQDAERHKPVAGDYFGIVFAGGWVVPILMTCGLTAVVFFIERLIVIGRAQGTGDINTFVRKIQSLLDADKIDEAIKECDNQKGSVGNVTLAALKKYKQLVAETGLDKEQKLTALSKEVEEATTLEMPMLEKNLTIIATLASVATLLGLFGTVLGMIRSFAALGAGGGAGDASALANGISEALINTALGIGTSAICIVGYNYFTSSIDTLTYSIDEIGLSISNNFAAKHN
jgi:biopolymer transport protein ExbB